TNGRIEVAYGTFGAPAPPTGSGTIALITVIARSADPANLSFDNVILADAQEPPIQFDVSLEGARVNGGSGSPGDANCDQDISAADLPALLKLLATGALGSCGLADANRDGSVDEDDIGVIIHSIFTL